MATHDMMDALFEDGGRARLAPDEIAQISHDVESWFGFLRMLAGLGPAVMRAKMDDEHTESFVVAPAGTFQRQDTFATYRK